MFECKNTYPHRPTVNNGTEGVSSYTYIAHDSPFCLLRPTSTNSNSRRDKRTARRLEGITGSTLQSKAEQLEEGKEVNPWDHLPWSQCN